MPRNGSGTYSLPQPAFAPSTVISSSAVNSDLSDIALALTASIAADGQTPITGTFNIIDGTAAAPSYGFITSDTDGMYHPGIGQLGFAISGIQGFLMQAPSASAGGGLTGQSGTVLCPVGVIQDFAGSSAPSGWFLCYGQAVSRSTYSELFAVIGTTWGSGDGSSTFNVPDLRGRATAGKDDMGGSAASRITSGGSGINGASLGAAGGVQNNTIAQANLPNVTLTTTISAGQGSHTHTFSSNNAATINGNSFDAGGFNGPNSAVASLVLNSATLPQMTGTTPTGGSGTAVGNVQPTAIVNKIIFAGHP